MDSSDLIKKFFGLFKSSDVISRLKHMPFKLVISLVEKYQQYLIFGSVVTAKQTLTLTEELAMLESSDALENKSQLAD